jgi:hypothetical protein
LNYDSCTPACASGNYLTYQVELQVSDPRQCTLNVYQPHSDVPKPTQAYVFNSIYVKAQSGNPPASLTGYTNALPAACGSASGTPGPAGSDLKITSVGTYRKGVLVYFSVHYADPNNYAKGFGFVGVNGSGWAEEKHPFSSPSYGIIGPHSIDYPFNLGCGTAQQTSSEVEAWIYGTSGVRSQPVVIRLTCSAGAR